LHLASLRKYETFPFTNFLLLAIKLVFGVIGVPILNQDNQTFPTITKGFNLFKFSRLLIFRNEVIRLQSGFAIQIVITPPNQFPVDYQIAFHSFPFFT
jgi:hypothetical protein